MSKRIKVLYATVLLGCMLLSPSAGAQNGGIPEINSSALFSGTPNNIPKDIVTRAKAHTELAALYFQSGNLIVALEELTIAIAINPDYAPAYGMRGVVLFYVKEFASAESDFETALNLKENDPEINNNYGWFLCQTKRERKAIPYFERAMRNPLYQTPENAYVNAGGCYIKLGELDIAEDYIQKSLRISPNNREALFQLALLDYLRKNYSAARTALLAVSRSTDLSPAELWLLLRIERHLGDRGAEESLALQLRRRYPESPEYEALLKGNYE